MKPRVLVTDFINDDLAFEKGVLGDIADVVGLNAKTAADLVGQVETAETVMAFHTLEWTPEVLAYLKKCKLLVRVGVGYDNVDKYAARALGIPLANVPDYGTAEIADSALGLMLSLTRGINLFNNRLQRGLGPWNQTQAAPVYRLRDRTVGIVGLGRIGSAVALRAKAFDMNVVYYDPYCADGADKSFGITRVETLDELLSQTHVLSLHCPLTDETRNLIDAQAIAKLARGSFLVNTSRGAVLDVDAIPAAIESGHLAGAGLDVLPHEPPPADSPLLKAWRDPNHLCHDRLILNPHAAFYSVEGLRDMRTKAAQACRRALLNQPLRNVVN
ncbi:C-terminal binding protein [soil metagenome]